jgi:hypothetical protein
MNPLKIGDPVRLSSSPPYLKTADPMPMLRPPDLVTIGEQGVLMDQRPGGFWVIHFPQGTFLLDEQYFERIEGVLGEGAEK